MLLKNSTHTVDANLQKHTEYYANQVAQAASL